MAIFRGVGGSGESSDNSFLQAVTAQAQAAEASATSAQASANSILNLTAATGVAGSSASYNASTGVLTIPRGDTGATGATGPQGPQGPQGATGATGPAGADGADGTNGTNGTNGTDGTGFTGGSYNASTGVVTFTSNDGLGFSTSDLRGADGADGSDANVTAANVTGVLTGGTGISIASNGTITNSLPDQTVALTGTGATSVTGTYPNFTINSTNTTYTVGDGGLTTNDFTDADHTKLDGIEANATADQTGAEIKTAYEAEADTNAFTDAEKTKLSGIEASATADQTDAEIKTAYENNADTNAFTDADHSKLDGIEANADVTDTANVTAAGALMDSEVTNLAQVKAFDSSDYATAAQGSTADSALQNVVEDTTPQLGGNLDLNSKTVNGSGSIDINGGLKGGFVESTSNGLTYDAISSNQYSPNMIYGIQKKKSSNVYQSHGGIGTTNNSYGDGRTTFMSQGTIAVGVFGIFGGTATNYSQFQPCTSQGGNHNGKMRLGQPSSKWSQLYASTSTINTSDRNLKQQIETLSDAETRVAVAAKGLLRKYRFNESVEEKGNDARIHFGIIAQDLQDAFTAEGLNAFNYSMFCSDTWWEHEGETYYVAEAAPEGATEITQLGVRYSELLAFIIAAI